MISRKNMIFESTDYRQFLRDELKSRDLSYQQFVDMNEGVVSFSTLSNSLNSKFGLRTPRSLSFEMLSQIGKSLQLSDAECRYLILLKLFNDAEVSDGRLGATFKIQAGEILKSFSQKAKAHVDVLENSNFSPFAYAAAEILDHLPEASKVRLGRRILLDAKGELSRHQSKPGIRKLGMLVQIFENLLGI